MTSGQDRSSERRWIVLSEDGRFVTLGRASDPSEQEILDAEAALVRQGLAGWLAVMQGNPYVGMTPRLMEVRVLGTPTSTFEKATEACVEAILRRRQEADG
ncbi:MAG: hypothetical protein K2X49_16625 [Acetobacteraceae bacterium]|nr:hypothetical protein [Acetobacteraceae bacterium]